MNVNIPQEEYNRLVEEARAWRHYVRTRLEHGQVPSKIRLTCIDGQATIRISDPIVVTPFGKMNVTMNEGGFHDFPFRPGNVYDISPLVQLRIN